MLQSHSFQGHRFNSRGWIHYLKEKMSLKSLPGFPFSSENLSPSTELRVFGYTVVSVSVVLVAFAVYKYTQNKNSGRKQEEPFKTAERNSTEYLSSRETENETKYEDPVSVSQTEDVKAEVQQLQDESHMKENLESLEKDLRTNNAELELKKTVEQLKQTQTELESKRAEICELRKELDRLQKTRWDTVKGMRESFPQLKLFLAITRIQKLEDKIDEFRQNQSKEYELDTLKKKLETTEKELERLEWLKHDTIKGMRKPFSQLKLTLAYTRMQKLEDKLDTFYRGQNQSLENDLAIVKRKLEDKEKQLEKVEYLRNDGVQGKQGSFSQLKLTLAITRMQKLEDKVDELLRGKNKSLEKELKKLKKKLDDKEKELQESEAEVQKLLVEQKKREEDERNLLTMQMNSPDFVLNEELDKVKEQLRDEQQNREVAELTVQTLMKRLDTKNEECNKRVAELKQQLEEEKQRREDVEKDLLNSNDEVDMGNKEALSSELDDLLSDIEKLYGEMLMKESTLLKKELETHNKEITPPSVGNIITQTFEELKETQTQLENRNAEIRRLQKESDNKLNVEKQRSEKELQTLKKELEAKNKELEKNIQDEQQRREDVEKEVEVLKQKLENMRNQAAKAEIEEAMKNSEASGDELLVATEPHGEQDIV